MSGWLRRFLVRGVFWRRFLRFAVLNVPTWMEPIAIGTWALIFLLWGPGRRGVMRNLKAIKPGSWAVTNFLRTYRVFWNFACTIGDTARFRESGTMPDWEFAGLEHFERMLAHDGGAIILTAHMGSYDLGAQVFSATSERRIVMVRAPEVDPETRSFEESRLPAGDTLRVDFNVKSTELAIDLLHALQRKEFVAIQGDRVTPGIASFTASLFGRKTELPAGPFALAMAAHVPVFPLFIIRVGRRRYRLLACHPIQIERTSRKRDDDIRRAIDKWTSELEPVIRSAWFQWFAFEPFSAELA